MARKKVVHPYIMISVEFFFVQNISMFLLVLSRKPCIVNFLIITRTKVCISNKRLSREGVYLKKGTFIRRGRLKKALRYQNLNMLLPNLFLNISRMISKNCHLFYSFSVLFLTELLDREAPSKEQTLRNLLKRLEDKRVAVGRPHEILVS